MKPHYKIIQSKLVKWAAAYEGEKFHAVLCDPPYGISFMGKEWDEEGGRGAFQEQVKQWGAALQTLLYPGALVFMFGGTRTWHRLAAGMEDAGFELFDTLMWIHGQGFPKAQDISKLVDKANGDARPIVGERDFHGNAATSTKEKGGTYVTGAPPIPAAMYPVTGAASEESAFWSGHKTAALKPAWEPILAFRAPDDGNTYAELAMGYGSGALNVDAGRIQTQDEGSREHGGKVYDAVAEGYQRPNKSSFTHKTDWAMPSQGRYPANLVLECICETTESIAASQCDINKNREGEVTSSKRYPDRGGTNFTALPGQRRSDSKIVKHTNPNCPAFQLDEQSGELTSGANPTRRDSDKTGGIFGEFQGHDCIAYRGAEQGSASRFFYCAKASREEREAGLNAFPENPSGMMQDDNYKWQQDGKGNSINLNTRTRNNHPTVKPTDLNRWLASLLLPPPVRTRRILVPFAGVASEMIGCLLAGWDEVVGIEKDAEYCRIGAKRLEHWTSQIHEQVNGEAEIENRTITLTQAQRVLF